MKKIKHTIACLLFAGLGFSCAGFLDEDVRSSAAPDLIFNSQSGVLAATRGCYSIFTEASFKTQGGIPAYGITPSAQRYMFLLTEVPGDDCWIRNTNNNPRVVMDTYQFDADNENIAAMYFSHFLGIKNCNFVLRNIETSPVADKDFLRQMEAEARGIRAFCYFNYVRLFGDGPVITSDVDVNSAELKRQPAKLIYRMVVDDLEFAAGVLPMRHSEGAGRFSSAAAKSLLAEVYLTMAGRVYNDVKDQFDGMSRTEMYRKAAGYAADVIAMPGYSLFADYRKMFTVEGNNCVESILEAVNMTNQFAVEACPDVQNSYDTYKDPATGEQPFRGMFYGTDPATGKARFLTNTLGRWSLTPELKAKFDAFPVDKRLHTLQRSINGSFGNINLEVWSSTKYADSTIFSRNLLHAKESRAHYKMIRLAHVMLLYAEAANEAGNGPDAEAREYLKRIRERAGITASTIPTSYEAFKTAVMDERRKELYFEGYRWYDLVRTGTLKEYVEAAKSGVNYKQSVTVQDKHYLFPVPNQAFTLNPALGDNNPGWSN